MEPEPAGAGSAGGSDAAAHLAAIVESSDDAIMGKTLDGVITSWNAGAERMYGYTAQEMVGRHISALIPPDRTAEQRCIVDRLRRGERIGHFETQRIRKDGTVLDASVSMSPIRDASGMVTGAAVVARDITERNRMLQAERQSRSHLAAVVECTADAVIGATPEGTITCWNNGAEQLCGYTAAEMVGQRISVLFPPECVGDPADIMRAVRLGERYGPVDTRWVRNGGSVIDVFLSVSPIRDAAGMVEGAALVSQDLTLRNRAVKTRHDMESRSHQAERMETLGQLAGGVAHDFNNLLGAIVGYAGLIAAATDDRPEVQADVEQIHAAAERAARLTRELLTFSRREPVPVAPVDLNKLVAGAHELMNTSLGSRAQVRQDLAPHLPRVLGDPGRLEQVLLNLAINARDAMPDGGVLTIRTRSADLAEGDARLDPGVAPGRFVELAVSDTGTGMSASTAAHAFEPFFTTKASGRGTGLGLSSVYGIVTGAGGMVSIDTTEGEGTTFYLYLPVASRAAPATAAPRRTVPWATGHGEVILVVDDEPAMLTATSRILRQNGYATLEAASCDEALGLASANEFQLLLTDSVMPGMSGAALADRVREVAPVARVLHMSGYAPGTADLTMGEGTAFIQKPFTPQTLLAKIGAVLGTGAGVATGSPGTDPPGGDRTGGGGDATAG